MYLNRVNLHQNGPDVMKTDLLSPESKPSIPALVTLAGKMCLQLEGARPHEGTGVNVPMML